MWTPDKDHLWYDGTFLKQSTGVTIDRVWGELFVNENVYYYRLGYESGQRTNLTCTYDPEQIPKIGFYVQDAATNPLWSISGGFWVGGKVDSQNQSLTHATKDPQTILSEADHIVVVFPEGVNVIPRP